MTKSRRREAIVSVVQIRAIGDADRDWLASFFQTHWGSPKMVYSHAVFHCDMLPGFAACRGEEMIGLITYIMADEQCQVVSLDSLEEGKGVGTALLQAVEEASRQQGADRVWLLTTNDNLHALRFYQKRGYELVRIHRGAVQRARQIKPEIPLVGNDGIPILDEIELEKVLNR
jgi:ribosomal protein S18 acetylase RimI-like enzyme